MDRLLFGLVEVIRPTMGLACVLRMEFFSVLVMAQSYIVKGVAFRCTFAYLGKVMIRVDKEYLRRVVRRVLQDRVSSVVVIATS